MERRRSIFGEKTEKKVIDRVHARYNTKAQLLDDDDVEFVNAAGVQDPGMKKKSLLKDNDERS